MDRFASRRIRCSLDINADNEGIFNSEGFYQMSDVGYFETGMLYFCDRLKDLIRVGDHDVYPVTAEDVLDSHPDVLQVFCIQNGWVYLS